jgi:hypothetical protein
LKNKSKLNIKKIYQTLIILIKISFHLLEIRNSRAMPKSVLKQLAFLLVYFPYFE